MVSRALQMASCSGPRLCTLIIDWNQPPWRCSSVTVTVTANSHRRPLHSFSRCTGLEQLQPNCCVYGAFVITGAGGFQSTHSSVHLDHGEHVG